MRATVLHDECVSVRYDPWLTGLKWTTAWWQEQAERVRVHDLVAKNIIAVGTHISSPLSFVNVSQRIDSFPLGVQ